MKFKILCNAITAIILCFVGSTFSVEVLGNHTTATASVSASPSNGFGPLDVQFNVSVSPASDPNCIADNFTIDFGDGSIPSNGSASGPLVFGHTYEQPGSYFPTVNFVVHANHGGSAIDCFRGQAFATTTVTVLSQQTLTAVIDASTTFGSAPLTVKFDASRSFSDPNCQITSYNWSFGDDQSGIGVMTEHTYTEGGLFGVVLTLGDTCARVDSDFISIEVGQVEVPFNGVPVYTSQIEPAIKPPCSCDEPTYNSGIAQASNGCARCGAVGEYPGISNDTGGQTVLLHNGEFVHFETDLVIPGRGFDWKFERKYRSGVIFEGPLGNNWDFNYNRRLIIINSSNLQEIAQTFPGARDGDVVRMDGYARADLYTFENEGPVVRYKSPTGYYTELTRNSNGGFVERDRSGSVVVYDSPNLNSVAVMAQISDRNHNSMQFEHTSQGQLTAVTDTLGRVINYIYDQEGHLIEVRDFADRSIKFSYDENGDLDSATSPVVTITPNFNDFPDGKTTRYEYSSGFSEAFLNHNLLSIMAPNEVANGGQPRYLIGYDTLSTSATAGRVQIQTVGGRSLEGFAAGGTIHYEYEGLLTRVVDRNGNQTEYEFNEFGNIIRLREYSNRSVRQEDPDIFETLYEYNFDGELTRMILPEGNEILYQYDLENVERQQQGNLLAVTEIPDSARSGDQVSIVSRYEFEPIYNKVRMFIEPRGNDPSYSPQNGGPQNSDRYTTNYFFDYQEGSEFIEIASQLNISEEEARELLSSIPMNLGDLNGDGITSHVAGNVVRIDHPSVALLSESNQSVLNGSSLQQVAEIFVYNDFGQSVRKIDPEGNVTLFDYYPENDPDGNQQDFIIGLSTRSLGYLKESVSDAESGRDRNSGADPEPAAIKTEYFYDSVGNVIRKIDGRGVSTEFSVNQLNQVVEVRKAVDVSEALDNLEEPNWRSCFDNRLIECTQGMEEFGYFTQYFYDHNDNIVKVEVENANTHNQGLAGNTIEFTAAYDMLDNRIEQTEEVSESPDEILTTRYRYDRNENLALVLSPLAVNREQPSNVVSILFDERDLPFETTRGGLTNRFQSALSNQDIQELRQIQPSIDLSTTTKSYDRNRNIRLTFDAIDNSGNGQPDSTFAFYDGFDRLVSHVDALGDQSFINYDPAGNMTRWSFYGPVGGQAPSNPLAASLIQPLTLGTFNQPLLERTEYLYDELNRRFEERKFLYDYDSSGISYLRNTQLQDGPLGFANDGIVVTRFEYDRNSRLTFKLEDDADTFQNVFDGVGRVIQHIDPEGNEIHTTFDDNHNVVHREEIDVTQPLSVVSGRLPSLREIFVTDYVYDSLDRLIRTSDNLGQTFRYQYDSRNNLISTTDSQFSPSEFDSINDSLGIVTRERINLPGNKIDYYYDGINRKIAEVRELREEGQARNRIDNSSLVNPDGLIVTDYEYDANSRLIARADDGSSVNDQNTTIGFIEASNPRGNVTRYTYDDLNRRLEELFDDGTIRSLDYDLDDNLVRAIDSNGSVFDNIYDGLNRVTRRTIAPASSESIHPSNGFKDPLIFWDLLGTTEQRFEYDGLSRITSAFDNNVERNTRDDSQVTRAYDSLSRLLEEVQNNLPVSNQWMGDDNRIGLQYPNDRNIALTFDKLDRIESIGDAFVPNIANYEYIGRSRVLQRQYGNGVELTFLDPGGRFDNGYDGLRRIVGIQHRKSSSRLVAGFEYEYNNMNHKLSEEKIHDSNLREEYSYDSRYRLIEFDRDGEPNVTWELDGVNNWIDRNNDDFSSNNMNEYSSIDGVEQIHDDNGNLLNDGVREYRYDADNKLRRVTRLSDRAIIADFTYDAFGRRVTKDINDSSQFNGEVEYYYDGWRVIEERHKDSTQQFVYGNRIDEPLTMDVDINNDSFIDERYYYHEDGKGYIIALTDESGNLVEELSYDAYGVPSIDESSIDNPYMFAARRYEPETGLYYYRARFYDAERGRFLQRDPIGNWTDSANFGNSYTYVGNNPISFADPSGNAAFMKMGWVSDAGGGGNEPPPPPPPSGDGSCTCGYNCSCDPDPCCGKTCSCGSEAPDPGISVITMMGSNPCPGAPRAKKIYIGGLSAAQQDSSDDDDTPPGTIVVAPPDTVPPPAPAPDWDKPTHIQLGFTTGGGGHAAQECCGKSCSCDPTPKPGNCCGASCSCPEPKHTPILYLQYKL
jgi:RHS repeat-associated protein